MDFANPVKLLGRVVLLVYGLSGGANDSRPPVEAKQHPGDERAARQQELDQDEALRRQYKELERQFKELSDELKRLQAEGEERAREAAEHAQKLLDEKLREIERLQVELKQAQRELKESEDYLQSLRKQLDEHRKKEPLQQLEGPQQQESNPHSRREAILGRVSLPAMRSIDGHGWRVDRQGIIRDRHNQPIGVWGVDDGEPALKLKR